MHAFFVRAAILFFNIQGTPVAGECLVYCFNAGPSLPRASVVAGKGVHLCAWATEHQELNMEVLLH